MNDFSVDNPGGAWLREKQDYADSKPRLKGLIGATTAYFNKPVKLPTDIVNQLPGANDEQKYRNSSIKLQDLEKEIGHPNNFDTQKYPILIGVNHHGKAYILEGNHRTAYANKYKKPHIYAEVKYFNGGEANQDGADIARQPGGFSPSKVQNYSKEVSMIRMEKLTAMLNAETTRDKAFASLSDKEAKAFEIATGVQETKVYSGPEGTIHRQDMLSGTQYRALHKNKNHYHNSQRGAMNWLKKQHAKTQSKDTK